MSEINKNLQSLFDRRKTETDYRQGSGNVVQLGTEIESWLVKAPELANQPATMMTRQDSQAILSGLAGQDNAVVYSEDKGNRIPGVKDGLPIVMIEQNEISFQLELCGVLEAATQPYKLTDTNALLDKINLAQRMINSLALKQGLSVYNNAVLGSAKLVDCEKSMVNRERLCSEWQKFKLDGQDSPGLRTMGLAASTQVSISYGNEKELKEIFQLGNLLSPLLIGAFANTSGFEEGKRTNRISRAQWWLDHNRFAPRGGVPNFALDIMFGTSQQNVAAEWIDYASTTPMVYYIDESNKPNFSSSPTFNELFSKGLGTQVNYALAESLTWPDIKLIGGKRVEMRMCDTGPWQPQALTIIGASLMADEKGRKQALEMLYATEIQRETYIQARTNVSYKGLDTKFGKTDLRKLLPDIFDLACENAIILGIKEEYLVPLKILSNRPISDFEIQKNMYKSAMVADYTICKESPSRQPLICNDKFFYDL